jgi:hypothetical protein
LAHAGFGTSLSHASAESAIIRGTLMRFFRRWALNRADLILGLASVFIMTLIASIPVASEYVRHLLFEPTENAKGLAAALLAGWVAIFLACLGGAVRITSARQSLISLLSSEIKAIQYGLQKMDMFEFWASVFEHPEIGAVGFADVPREESYFEIFHSVSDNIGNLHPNVVESIVRFYTYLKMSRDAAAVLKSWHEQTDPEIRRLHIKYVVNLLSLSMLWGFVALWTMGIEVSEQEEQLRRKMENTYNTVFGIGEFEKLLFEHVRSAALKTFFTAEGKIDCNRPA